MMKLLIFVLILLTFSPCYAGVLEEANKLISENKSIQTEIDAMNERWFFDNYGDNRDAVIELVWRYRENMERYNELRATREGSSLMPMPTAHHCLTKEYIPHTRSELYAKKIQEAKDKKESAKSKKEFIYDLKLTGLITLGVVSAVAFFFFIINFVTWYRDRPKKDKPKEDIEY